MNSEWRAKQKARFAKTDGTVEVHNGKEWARIHPKKCPHCGSVFYAWKPLEGEWEAPHRYDPEPRIGGPNRETCGDPECWRIEDEHQFARLVEWREKRAKEREQNTNPTGATKTL